jgi:hypothetical protein
VTAFLTLESAALSAELKGNWLHAAQLWRQAATVAVGTVVAARCEAFAREALEAARRTHVCPTCGRQRAGAPLPVAEVDIDAIHRRQPA